MFRWALLVLIGLVLPASCDEPLFGRNQTKSVAAGLNSGIEYKRALAGRWRLITVVNENNVNLTPPGVNYYHFSRMMMWRTAGTSCTTRELNSWSVDGEKIYLVGRRNASMALKYELDRSGRVLKLTYYPQWVPQVKWGESDFSRVPPNEKSPNTFRAFLVRE